MYPNPILITQIGKGNLYIMGKPVGGEYLKDDLRHLQNLGVNSIVSLLEAQEASELGLSSEGQFCIELGIAFENLTVQDRSIPTDNVKFIESVCISYQAILAGANLVAHCRAGIGRSGIYTTSILICYGHTASEAFKLVSDARGFPIPDTQAQLDWVHDNEAVIQNAA